MMLAHQYSHHWDGRVGIAANGKVDPRSMTAAVLAFVLTGGGLMENLTLDGAKISSLDI